MSVFFQSGFFQDNWFQTGNYPVGSSLTAAALTIAGVPQEIRAGTLRITETINGRNTFDCDVVSWNGSYRPVRNTELVYTINGERMFAGIVDAPSERGLFPSHGGRILVNQVAAVDFNSLADRVHVYETIPAGTLESHLLVITSYLAIFGVTLDPAQVSGPAVPERAHNLRPAREVLDELSVLTGYIWEDDYYRVLRMIQPGSVSAPFNVVPASDPSVVVGDIVVEHEQTDYANRIIVLAGTGIREQTEIFIGDGVTRTFPLSVPMAGSPRIAETNVWVTWGVYGTDTDHEWTYRASDNTIVQLPEAPAGTFHAPLSAVEWVSTIYPGQAPYVVTAEDAAEIITNGPWEKVIEEPDVWDKPTAQGLADAYLQRYVSPNVRVQYTTRRSGIKPGQTQTITVPSRNVSGTFLITDTEITDTVDNRFSWTVTAVGGTTYLGSWRDFYRALGGSSKGGPAASVSSPGGVGGSAVVISSPVSLGGSRNTAVAKSPAIWTPVPEYQKFTARATFQGLVRADLRARSAGVSATCRLYNITDAAVVAVSNTVTSQTDTAITPFLVGITTGKTYRLEVLSSANGEGVFCIGTLEAA